VAVFLSHTIIDELASLPLVECQTAIVLPFLEDVQRNILSVPSLLDEDG
jgi:hypothetical protein